ncbi:hypothetical protein [Paraferrimonas sp. SM1919]|uniref:hypothetical protein n=1 Tax=Paraferrimonas sp. SM1919 TaxID=2662263 RepID=UPI0013D7CEE3|nr:hypothetical protein [Paraferrimonas sp. SM1919]
MQKQVKKLLQKHSKLTHSENMKVVSHSQRPLGEWVVQTLMIEGIDVPFKYKRTKKYQSLQGARVNLTYYPAIEVVAGFEIEIMKVVRIKRA